MSHDKAIYEYFIFTPSPLLPSPLRKKQQVMGNPVALSSPASAASEAQNYRKLSVAHKTRSTGTVHTSAKARPTSVAIRIGMRIRDPDRHQNLIICSLARC